MQPETKNKFDLEERTMAFGEFVIDFCRKLPQNVITRPLISQLIRSATSVGANYMEANSASSRKDFRNKIYICKKEIQETGHWFRMLERAVPGIKEEIKHLITEKEELTLIFGRILSTIRTKDSE